MSATEHVGRSARRQLRQCRLRPNADVTWLSAVDPGSPASATVASTPCRQLQQQLMLIMTMIVMLMLSSPAASTATRLMAAGGQHVAADEVDGPSMDYWQQRMSVAEEEGTAAEADRQYVDARAASWNDDSLVSQTQHATTRLKSHQCHRSVWSAVYKLWLI